MNGKLLKGIFYLVIFYIVEKVVGTKTLDAIFFKGILENRKAFFEQFVSLIHHLKSIFFILIKKKISVG